MPKNFYFAMIEVDTEITEDQGKRFVSAMNEFKASPGKYGKVTYVQVARESEYRRVEQEIK
jgi:hypothetical protein